MMYCTEKQSVKKLCRDYKRQKKRYLFVKAMKTLSGIFGGKVRWKVIVIPVTESLAVRSDGRSLMQTD